MKRLTCVLLILGLLTGLVPAVAQEIRADVAMDIDDIKCLQIDLIAGGYLEGVADGILGGETQAAVLAAQEALGFEADGYVTSEFSAALVKNAFPLQQDARSSVVYRLQQRLCQWGFLEEDPTGYFGSATNDAAIFFQEYAIEEAAAYMQSEADAVYDAMEVPEDVVLDRPLYTSENVPCDGTITDQWYAFIMEEYQPPQVIAARNDSGEGVKRLQKRLHELGYLYTGLDGAFGSVTELALKYFQRKNGLPETGTCDAATSDKQFSQDPVTSEEYVMPYMAYVKRSKSRVYIYGWDGDGYDEKVKEFKCSCGKPATPTIEGTFYAIGPISEWYYMENSNVWVKYAFQIQGNYFFHSVLFKNQGNKYPTSSSVRNLGSNVSHGCIRLAEEDVKWIYENCTRGMKVVIE